MARHSWNNPAGKSGDCSADNPDCNPGSSSGDNPPNSLGSNLRNQSANCLLCCSGYNSPDCVRNDRRSNEGRSSPSCLGDYRGNSYLSSPGSSGRSSVENNLGGNLGDYLGDDGGYFAESELASCVEMTYAARGLRGGVSYV